MLKKEAEADKSSSRSSSYSTDAEHEQVKKNKIFFNLRIGRKE